MTVFIQNYAAVLIIAIVNVLFQISVFVICVYKYKSRGDAERRISLERNLSMSVDSGSSIRSVLTRSPSMSPKLAAEYILSMDHTETEDTEKKVVNGCGCYQYLLQQ
eukprot:900209_1